MIREDCHYIDYTSESSLNMCRNPKRKCESTDCEGCPHYISEKDYEIRNIERHILFLQHKLRKLKGEE